MDIVWYGHSCFRLSERGKAAVLTDPYGPALGLVPNVALRADVVTISHTAHGHDHVALAKGDPYVVQRPGEYEVGGVFVTGIALHNPLEGGQYAPNVAYLFNVDGLSVLHLGDLAHTPEQSMVEDLGAVNVLLLPVGGGNALRAAQAAEVVALIEPNYIVPMHYALPGLRADVPLDDVDKFLKVMGISTPPQPEEMLRLSGSADSLPEQPQIVLLRPQIGVSEPER